MIKKGEILLHAIGELPEDIVAEEDIYTVKLGARQLEKEERKKKLIYISRCMVAAAACITALVISIHAFYKPVDNKPNESIQHSKIYSDIDNYTNHNNTNIEKTSVHAFVMDIKEETVEDSMSSNEKKTTSNNYNNATLQSCNMKKIPYGKTVDLHLTEQTYIVFTLDADFYLTNANKKGKTYITKKNQKKHYIKGAKTSCKAGNQVYLDVSNNKTALDIAIPEWKEQGISIIAYAETDKVECGTFYIGKTDNKNKKGDEYYGIFIKKN